MVKVGKWLKSLVGSPIIDSTLGDEEKIKGHNEVPKDKDKRRWSFGKSKECSVSVAADHSITYHEDIDHEREQLNNREMVVAAAEAALVAAIAAGAVLRLSGNRPSSIYGGSTKVESAAIKIQSAFRGYLARHAIRALRGLVKLQALVRGHLVRKQAATTFRCMQALLSVQAKARARSVKTSEERRPLPQQLLQTEDQEVAQGRSQECWHVNPDTVKEPDTKHQRKQSGTIKQEIAAAYFSLQQQLRNARPEENTRTIATEPVKLNEVHPECSKLERWIGCAAACVRESPLFDNLAKDANCRVIMQNGAQQAKIDIRTSTPELGNSGTANISEEASSTNLADNSTIASTPFQPFIICPTPDAAASHSQLISTDDASSAASRKHQPVRSRGSHAPTYTAAAVSERENSPTACTPFQPLMFCPTPDPAASHSQLISTAEASSAAARKQQPVRSDGSHAPTYTPAAVSEQDVRGKHAVFPTYMANTKSWTAKVRCLASPKHRQKPVRRFDSGIGRTVRPLETSECQTTTNP